MQNPVEARQEQERRERARMEAAAADADRRRRERQTEAEEAAQEDAHEIANLADPVYTQDLDARRRSSENVRNAREETLRERQRVHRIEIAQREEAAAAATAALIRQQRDNNPDAAAWDRATQIPIPGGRRHRKTRKHSRKHTKKNRKVSRRKMTRRRR